MTDANQRRLHPAFKQTPKYWETVAVSLSLVECGQLQWDREKVRGMIQDALAKTKVLAGQLSGERLEPYAKDLEHGLEQLATVFEARFPYVSRPRC